MQCPYCAEDIKDAAVFCRHCKHDLSFYKSTLPMLDQLSSLEDRVSLLENRIAEITATLHSAPHLGDPAPVPPSPSGPQSVLPLKERIFVVVLPALGVILANFLYWLIVGQHMSQKEHIEAFTSNIYGWDLNLGWDSYWTDILLLGAPLLAGVWVGFKQSRRSLKTYIRLGVLTGILATMGLVLSDATMTHPPLQRSSLDDVLSGRFLRNSEVFLNSFIEGTLMVYLLFGLIVTAMMFVSGGLFGDLIENMRSHRSITAEATNSKKVAGKLFSPNSLSFDRGVKILTVLYPATLAFTGTLLTIIFN